VDVSFVFTDLAIRKYKKQNLLTLAAALIIRIYAVCHAAAKLK
jgi:hypothetical protein